MNRAEQDAITRRRPCDLSDRESGCYSLCRAQRDGDCYWNGCPQAVNRQGHCPLDKICSVHREQQSSPEEVEPRATTPRERVFEQGGSVYCETAAGIYQFNLVNLPDVRVWRLERRSAAGWVRWQCDDPSEGIYCEDSDGSEAEAALPYVELSPEPIAELLRQISSMLRYCPSKLKAPR